MEKGKYKLKVNYDPSADVLYVSFYDPPWKAIGYDAGPGMITRESLWGNEIVGITILDFKERFIDEESNHPKPNPRLHANKTEKLMNEIYKE